MQKGMQEQEPENQDEISGHPLSVEEKIDIIAKVIFDIWDKIKLYDSRDLPKNWDKEDDYLS